jgi:hypothetical protein
MCHDAGSENDRRLGACKLITDKHLVGSATLPQRNRLDGCNDECLSDQIEGHLFG